MTRLRRRVAFLLGLALFAVLPAATAGPQRFVTIDVTGATATIVDGINPAGDMVGGYYIGSAEFGFVMRGGVLTTIAYPGATATEAFGINPQGDIVGQYVLPNFSVHGFLLPHDASEPLPIDVEQSPAAGHFANTMPFKITPEGAIVGCLHESDAKGNILVPTMHGFVLNKTGSFVDPVAGSMNTGSNASGAVAGHQYLTLTAPFVIESYVIDQDAITTFSVPGYAITRAYDISANGTVVGFCRLNGAAPFHGFVMRNGTIEMLDVPGAAGTRAFGINAEGDIVGTYTAAGVTHGFLYTRRDAD